jgi:glycosyltransferase involved in cell wall biosynthesis
MPTRGARDADAGGSVSREPAVRLAGGRPTVSVCLCTCNGEHFLPELLESLSHQSQPPDEVVVCDDASDDATRALLERFAEGAPFPVRLEVNASRVGADRNFARALELATGAVLLPCDQDDVWDPRKIERVLERLGARDAPAAVLHDSSLLDASGSPLAGSLWQALGFGARSRQELERCPLGYLVRHWLVAGHALAVTRPVLELATPFSGHVPYDAWLGQLAAAGGGLALLDEALVGYRLHGRNVAGLSSVPGSPRGLATRATSLPSRLAEAAAGLGDLEARLDERRPGALPPALREEIRRRRAHLEARAGLGARSGARARTGDLVRVLREVAAGNYRRWSAGARSVALDLWRALGPRPTARASITTAGATDAAGKAGAAGTSSDRC